MQTGPFGAYLLFPGPEGIPDGNPEAIIVGAPLDGTKNVATALGNIHDDITGVVTFQYAPRFRMDRWPNAYTDSASTMSCPSQLRE